jgi:hypothetical protein
MLYTTITINNIDYKARLNAKACIDLEKKLGTNPINILLNMSSDASFNLPSLGTLITIIHCSLQAYEHGITLDKVYELYDSFIQEGHTMTDLIPIVVDIYKVSGLIPEDKELEGKN